MDLKEFINECKFAVDSGDRWGSYIGIHFDICEHIEYKGDNAPDNWGYRRGAVSGDTREIDSYWFDIFDNSSIDQLIEIGNFLELRTKRLVLLGEGY